MQDCSNCSALAMELLQSCTEPSILGWKGMGSYVTIYVKYLSKIWHIVVTKLKAPYLETCISNLTNLAMLLHPKAANVFVTCIMTSSNENISRVTDHLWGEPPVNSHKPVTWSFDVFFGLRLNKQLSKDSRRLRRHRVHYDVTVMWFPTAM